MAHLIRFNNVVKRYILKNGERKYILNGLSKNLPKRNIGILGVNGAGKSTLMRLIAGTELPNSGEIHKTGNVSWPLGFAGSFSDSLTGDENTRFVARIYGQNTEFVLDYVQSFAELGKYFFEPVDTYSSGMKARLAFGVSLAIDFDCYLVDEITAVGDTRFKQRSKERFSQKLQHSNIIMISHSNSSLKEYCDMGAVLHQGELELYSDLDEAIEVHEGNMID